MSTRLNSNVVRRPPGCSGGAVRALALVCLLDVLPTKAILFYSTADPSHNTTAPTGTLVGSGWQFEGQWGSFLGTAIAPQYFITAQHIGGTMGDPFVFGGVTYPTVAVFDDPNSDLRIWRVCGTFPTYALLYPATNEVGKTLVVIGRGTQRGDPVDVTSGPNSQLRGWRWGVQDGVQRWGRNAVGGIVSGDQIAPAPGGSHLGLLLLASFDANGGAEEATLSSGDSGGGVFIPDGSTWKLAGINYAADGLFNTTNTGPGFLAAIFDARGLYIDGPDVWTLVPNSPASVPGDFYATRISSNLDWILSVISTPAPDDLPVLQSAIGAAGPYGDNSNAVIDSQAKTITLATPADTQFYRLRACVPLSITGIQLNQGNLVLTYAP
ncbi:MAG: hypothetical protein ACYDH9_12780 [Limisphaerales bacterium]